MERTLGGPGGQSGRIKAAMMAPGFVLEAGRDMLRRSEGNPAAGVLASANRGETDRFFLKFRRS
ncbi:MAG: hypothetical protein IT549_15980 [Novosphingobium sp.]|nr:hypothetical protein [Novosphingobium sp.]